MQLFINLGCDSQLFHKKITFSQKTYNSIGHTSKKKKKKNYEKVAKDHIATILKQAYQNMLQSKIYLVTK